MIVPGYELPPPHDVAVYAHEDFAMIADRMQATSHGGPVQAFVWRGAFNSPALARHFASPTWPLELLHALPPSREWPWKSMEAPDLITEPSAIVLAASEASGSFSAPTRNAHIALELKTVDERETNIGGLEWWKDRRAGIVGASELGAGIVNSILNVIEVAAACGSHLFVEQLSIILSKAPSRRLRTLAPMIHSDKSYGSRQAAIASIIEAGWDQHGGTILLPTLKLSDIPHEQRAALSLFHEQNPNTPIVLSASGDILIYDGCLDASGADREDIGIPHVSPEALGAGARLAVLMHHKR